MDLLLDAFSDRVHWRADRKAWSGDTVGQQDSLTNHKAIGAKALMYLNSLCCQV